MRTLLDEMLRCGLRLAFRRLQVSGPYRPDGDLGRGGTRQDSRTRSDVQYDACARIRRSDVRALT